MRQRAAIIIPWLLLAVLVSCQVGPPPVIGLENQARPVSAEEGATVHQMFIATNRVESPLPGEFYSGERANRLSYSSVLVSVPPIHETGKIEQAAELPPDPKRHFMVISPIRYPTDTSLITAVNKALAERAPENRDILIFVHGYNTRMYDAILRFGQFVHDTGFEGVPVLFSWPSRGQSLQYVYDLNSALSSRDALEKAANVLVRSNVRGAHILAHSMGNMLAVETMRQVQFKRGLNRTGRLKTVVLASPDIDIDLFRVQLKAFSPGDSVSTYVLISQDDEALSLSRRIAGGVDRVGNSTADEFAGTGLTVIDLTEINDQTTSSHSKFAESPEVVQLIGRNMSAGGSLSTRPHILGENLPILIIPNQ